MARLALSKLGLSGNLLKTSIDWPRLDKAGPGWTRPAQAGRGRPGPARASGNLYLELLTGLGRPGQASVIFRFSLAWAGPGRPRPAMSCLGQPRPAWAGPARPLFCTGFQKATSKLGRLLFKGPSLQGTQVNSMW